jgi:hypothetical protein
MVIRASPAIAHYATLQKYFSHPSLVIYFFFPTSPIKLAYFDFSSSNFLLQGHILSTRGAALSQVLINTSVIKLISVI